MAERRISYAQNGEDIVLARALGNRQDGFYVDVGANDPTQDSVTRYFYERGWRGVNVEPQPDCFERLEAERPRDANLNIGVGARSGILAFFYCPEAPGTSTFSEERAEELVDKGYTVERQEFPVWTLDEVFTGYVRDRPVEFLKVDVEGLEQGVLGEFDWTRWRPSVVVAESEVEVSQWEKRMVAHGYRRTLWDGINVFLVRDTEDAALAEALSKPATVRDRYDPWLYVEQLRQAGENAEQRLRDTAAAHAEQLARNGAAYERQFARSAAAYERLLEQTRNDYEDRLSAARSLWTDLLEAALASGIGHASDDRSVRMALRALAGVLAERPDVLPTFMASRFLDSAGLLNWAASVNDREPHVDPLIDHLSVYRKLGQSRPSLRVEVGQRLGARAARLVRPTVRREKRT